MASGMRFGQYELGTRLAAGGMGEVFVARSRGAGAFEKELALKLLLPHLAEDPDLVTRFFDEARLAARMNHPNIVQIFDVGEVDGRPYLAMALVHGVSLGTLIRAVAARGELVPLPVVRLIATGLLEALAHAHALTGADGRPLGVIHRDVSPSNVLVSSAGAVFLTDFGLAKATINHHATRPGTLRGKAAYIAPEQLKHEPLVTRRADLFSAGVTLYHLLTLVSPFWRSTDVATMEAVLREAPPPASQLRGDAPAAMVGALQRALAKTPAERFSSARAFREAFVNGPVAPAPELGEYVERHCHQALAALTGSAGASKVATPTASLRSEGLSAPQSPNRRPWLIGVVGLGTASLLLGIGWQLSGPPAEAPAQDEAVVDTKEALTPGVATPLPASDDLQPDVEATVRPAQRVAAIDAGPLPREATGHPRVERPPHRTPEPRRPPTVQPVRLGYVTADARPWAVVILDGQEIERTPLSRFPVPIGRHRLVLKGPSGGLEAYAITVEEGQVVTVRADFASPPP